MCVGSRRTLRLRRSDYYILIKFSKHISAVQTHFPEVFKLSSIELITNRASNLSVAGSVSSIPANVDVALTTDAPSCTPKASDVIEDLERLTARMRLNLKHNPNPDLYVIVRAELTKLGETTHLLLARSPPIVSNHKSGWSATKQSMLPSKEDACKTSR